MDYETRLEIILEHNKHVSFGGGVGWMRGSIPWENHNNLGWEKNKF